MSLDSHEMQGNERVAGLHNQQEQIEQQMKARERVMALYQFEHLPLTTPYEQRRQTNGLWDGVADDLEPDLKESLNQLGKALKHVYALQADGAYTIEDRLRVRKAMQTRRTTMEGDEKVSSIDPLADRFVDDIILARVSLSGNMRSPDKIAAIARETREAFGNRQFEGVVQIGIERASSYFPKPKLLRPRQPVH